MSLKIRNFMLIAFVVLFLFLTILVSLYASGYKFNLSWPPKFNKLLQKTGILAISTVPKGATIYLDGKAQRGQTLKFWGDDYLVTPNKVKGLLPGEYELRLERDGYWPFEKKIRIEPGQTTFAEDLNLFNSNLPLLLASSSDGILKLNPNRRYLYSESGQKIINLKTGTEKLLPADTVGEGQWLASGKLFVSGQLFDPEKSSDIDYRKIIGSEAFAWYYDEASGNLYYQNKNSLNRLALDSKNNTVILSGGTYLSYEARGNHLFVVMTERGKVFLRDYLMEEQEFIQQWELPAVGDYAFSPDGRSALSLYDRRNQTLYLVDPNNLSADGEALRNVISWQWLDDNRLIYDNRWEIYLFDRSSGRSSLITRVSDEISQILWQGEKEYLVFLTAKGIQALDLRSGTITAILKTEGVSQPVLDTKDDLIYFNARIGKQNGIYKLLLQ